MNRADPTLNPSAASHQSSATSATTPLGVSADTRHARPGPRFNASSVKLVPSTTGPNGTAFASTVAPREW